MDNNSEILYEAFQIYYKRGLEAKECGNIKEAKRQLTSAAEALGKLAAASTGELKKARQERALRLIEIVESMSDGSVEERRADEATKKKPAGKDEKKRDSDGSETEWLSAEIPDVRFSDVAGLDEVKLAVRQRIIYPRMHPELYRRFDKKIGGGILMYGLPGTGKTMIAKAIAAEVGAKFYSVRCSDIVSKWFGEAEKNIRNLFQTARDAGEAVIFLDEFEALGAKRSGGDSAMNRLVPELLTQIQGFSDSDGALLIMAATNRPWDIDSAFMRSGRFNERLYIPLPDEEARRFLIEKSFKRVPVSADIDIADLVYSTEGYSGADIVELCEACKIMPIERAIAKGRDDGEIVTQEDVEEAKRKVKSSIQKADVELLEKFRSGGFN